MEALQQVPVQVGGLAEVARPRFTLDNIGAYVFTKDLEGRYTFANRMVLELFGGTLEAVLGKTDEAFFDLSVSDDLRRHDRRVIENGERIESEERNIVAATGEVRYYWSVKLPMRDADGRIIGLCGISTDITQRLAMEQALRESESRFQALFAQAPLGLVLFDCNGVVIDCNARMADFLGAPREKVIGINALRDARDRSLVEPLTKSLRGEPTIIEGAYTSTVGNRRSYCRYFFQPIVIGADIRYVLCFAEDIGDAKRAENLLLAREDLLTKILDTSSVAIFLVNPHGIITHANQRMAEMFDCPLDALVGSEYVARVHPSEREVGRQKMLGLLASDIPSVDLERLYWREDGVQFWGHLTGRRFHDAQGNNLGLVGVIDDIDGRRRTEQALTESQQRFRDLVDSTPGVVWEADAETLTFTYVNREAERVLGYPLAEWLTPGFCPTHMHPEDREWVQALIADHVARVQSMDFECRFLAADGRVVWLHHIVKIIPEDGKARWIRGVMVDVSDLKHGAMRQAAVVSAAMDGYVVIDQQARITDCNDILIEQTGYGREELLLRGIPDLDAYESPEEIAAHIDLLRRQGRHRFESAWRRKDGTVYEIEVTAVHLAFSGEICAFVRDISRLKAHERELDRIAHFDPLTGVPNRALLADRMNQAVAQTRRTGLLMAVCYIDLDGFKPVNDRFGHEAGDLLLVEIARRLESALRGGDTVARIGGDEFVLLLLGLNRPEECEVAIARVLDVVGLPVAIGENSVSVSASIGVALYPRDDVDIDTLLRHADQAMYAAKESGKNRYHLFDPEHDRLARDRSRQLAEIASALSRNEFVLHYQPQVNMRTGCVFGVEALVRWQHPERGLLPPGDFLPLIESHDLIVALGDWVLGESLRQLKGWQRQGLDLCMSVNLAARHLLRQDFVRSLARHLVAHPDIPPDRLELEVLETAALEDVSHVSSVIRECHDIGVHFALDDFGTGYSSLAYLKLLPAETLKIDQTFVRDMRSDAEDRAIVEGVIGLANVFRRKVIAEGVETADHGQLLLGMGCELAQGYGIARPMPPQELPAWIASWQPPLSWREPA